MLRPTRRHTFRPLFTAAVLACSVGLGLLAPAQAKDACPPVAQAPTQAQLVEGMQNAKDRGALWRITKDGRASYLFGTVHMGEMAWAFPGPKLLQALRETQVLAVEVDITDPSTQADMAAAMQRAGKVELSARDQARLDALADTACIPRGALASLHPIMQGITHVVLAGRSIGLDSAWGQEPTLIGFARAQQRPVVSLESIGSQMAVLLPADPAKARKSFDRLLDDLEKGSSAAELGRMGRAWEQGDLDVIGSLEKLCACAPTDDQRQAMRALNDERNPGLADRIAQEHAKGKPLLAAVGVLHMTGSEALPPLLIARGFAVERIAY
jgi:uncharacterized protein YbaP (TraB family)